MKAALIDRYGGNEVMEVRDVALPHVGPDDVLIKARAAAINPLDWKIRNGMVKIFTGRTFPKILGSECSGEVVAIGGSVQRFAQGDQVIGFTGIKRLAAFAEFVSAAERTTFPKPENITFAQAATIPIAGLTALQALRDLGRLTAGQSVLINGASGGVGTFAVQVARIFAAKVTAVCSGANAELVRELGAYRVIDRSREDFTKGSDRYDVIFDAVAKAPFAACKRVLAPNGIYVTTLPTFAVLLNQFLTGFVTAQKARIIMVKPNAQDMEWMKERIEARRIKVIIDREFPLDQVREAFAYSETGKAKGKVVLNIS
jgi:NADPH:quinone reductase-like Zn-dependent oxidoreductase